MPSLAAIARISAGVIAQIVASPEQQTRTDPGVVSHGSGIATLPTGVRLASAWRVTAASCRSSVRFIDTSPRSWPVGLLA